MKIRIITKPNNDGEVLWEDLKNPFSPVEIICPIEGKLIQLFQKDWEQFLARLLTSNPTKEEFREKLKKKSVSLEQIVFGNRKLPWKDPKFKGEIFLQTDPEFTAYPWEILTTNTEFFFEKPNYYRGIRSVSRITEQKKGSNFLLIENPVLPTLQDSVKSESRYIAALFEDNKLIPFRRLKSDQFKLARFWEEISEAAYLHYAGHTEKGGIPIVNEQLVLGEEIGRSKLPNLKVVFLNSCHSAYEGEHTSGLATQFLKSGAEFVFGFLSPIETKTAERIGKDFWQSYLKLGDPRKAYLQIKTSLQKGSVVDFASSLSFVCFSPEDKQRTKNALFMLMFCSLLLSTLFLFGWLSNQNDPEISKEEKKILPNEKQEKNQNKLTVDNSIPLKSKIAQIKDTNFKKKIQSFLKEENPLLSQKDKIKILEDVFSTRGTEEVKFYHFKQLTGKE
jgi:hypothetical protein